VQVQQKLAFASGGVESNFGAQTLFSIRASAQ
jgi:hypothetical protein